MAITCNTKAPWSLQDAYLKSVSDYWPSCSAASLWAWGYNTLGALGLKDYINRSSPVQVGGNNWLSGATNFALKRDNTLWVWGKDDNGSLGINIAEVPGVRPSPCLNEPLQLPGQWRFVRSTNYSSLLSTFGIKTDGTAWAWGYNGSGNLGLGNRDCVSHSSPTLLPGTTWVEFAPGYNHAAARKSDGTLWSMGSNSYGQIGNNLAGSNYSSPIQVPGTQWCKVCTNFDKTMALKTDGTLWVWGRQFCGSFGLNDLNVHRSSPAQIPGTQWVDMALYIYHAVGRKSDGTLWAWGDNATGALGNNSTVCFSSPIQVPGTQWTAVSSSSSTVSALKSDGTLWVWGSNNYGQFGLNISNATCSNASSPIQVPGQWVSIEDKYFSRYGRRL